MPTGWTKSSETPLNLASEKSTPASSRSNEWLFQTTKPGSDRATMRTGGPSSRSRGTSHLSPSALPPPADRLTGSWRGGRGPGLNRGRCLHGRGMLDATLVGGLGQPTESQGEWTPTPPSNSAVPRSSLPGFLPLRRGCRQTVLASGGDLPPLKYLNLNANFPRSER